MSLSILSLAPYKVLPPKTGGHLGIVLIHEYLGRLCTDHLACTVDNEPKQQYSFQLHPVFPADPKRYIPYNNYNTLLGIARKYHVSAIYCDHPYMSLTAMRLAGTLGINWIMRSHNIESERFRTLGKPWWPIMRSFERFAMKKAAGLLFVTEEDASWAVQHYDISREKCHFIPYGTTLDKKPVITGNEKQQVAAELGLDAAKPWLYFLGALDYAPNREAIVYILDEIMPRLHDRGVAFEILLAGKGLDEQLQQRIAATPNITYSGFVNDLDIFLKACDVMLNPVLTGGGIKTKAVEALGYNKRVVSCVSGATGLKPEVCGENLRISADHNWDAFTNDVITAINTPTDVPDSFYGIYYFGNIATKILSVIESTSPKHH